MISQSGQCDYSFELKEKEKKLGAIIMGMPINEESSTKYIGVANDYIEFLNDTKQIGDLNILSMMLEIFDLYHKKYIAAGTPFKSNVQLWYELALDVAEKAGLGEQAKIMGQRLSEIEKLCGHS